MKYTKQEIITEYLKLKEHLGHQPSFPTFFSETKIGKRIIEKIFGSDAYSKLVIECGDTPNKFLKPKSRHLMKF